MMELVFAFFGTIFIIGGLLSKRITPALLLLALGTTFVALAIGLLVNTTAGLLVSTVFAGALVALMALWLIIAEEETTRADPINVLSLAFMVLLSFALMVFIAFKYHPTRNPYLYIRNMTETDLELAFLAMLVSVTGALYLLRGDKHE